MLAIPFLRSTVSSVATVIYDMMLRRSPSPDPRPLYNITSFSGGEDSWAQWAKERKGMDIIGEKNSRALPRVDISVQRAKVYPATSLVA